MSPAPVGSPTPSSRLSRLTKVGLILTGLVFVVSLAAGGPAAALINFGSIAAVTALYSVMTGRSSWLMIRSRTMGVAALVGAVAITGIAGATTSPVGPTVVHLADADSAPTASATPSPTPQTRKPVVTVKEVQEIEDVPFESAIIDDPGLPYGTTAVTTVGVPGQRTIIYRVTLSDGRETDRTVVSDIVTVAPVTHVTSNGTYIAPVVAAPENSGCDSNYEGACVPIASDVDCAGGSGNGPAYVSGPVYVVGSDVYDLDRDGDGIACD